ncbi:hypothetical protein AB0L82_43075 [Nocardia sp. NPDC052001]|uniref:hypothetical protein n=1 Tax=Nocardia sp. NPDC052001 TaxID=3154853 RepID=UPI00341C72E9
MTSSEQPPQRKKSLLSEDDMWTVSAQPPAVTEQPARPPAAPPKTPPARVSGIRVDARPRETRGHARDLAEARGRKTARDAAHAWASAARKAADRRAELVTERDAALARGTDPAMLVDFILEACERHGVDWHLLPADVQADIAQHSTD